VVLTRLRIDELANAWVGDARTPFQIGLLGLFDAGPHLRPDGTIDVAPIRDELVARARCVPALGRRVVWTRVGEGRPAWARDPAFDPARHITVTTVPAGADLAHWAANRVTRPLAMDRPLWCTEILDGLPDGRFGLVVVLHHVAADGRGGVAIAGSLLDPRPDARPTPSSVDTAPSLPSHRGLLLERLHDLRAALRTARPPVAERLRRFRRGMGQAREEMAAFRTPEPVTSLPRRIGPSRRMVVVRQSLADVRGTGHSLDVTVNDLVLAAVTGGLRELLSGRGELVDGLVLRTTVPAATGRPGQVVGMLVVGLPVGEPDPLRRLARISRATTAGKTRMRAAGDVTDALHLPVFLARALVRRGRRFGSRRITLSVTDVPGPPAPLWLAGARLLTAVPIAPLVPLVPLSAAALSYSGELAVSVNADAEVDDLDVLAAGVERSFAELRELALIPRSERPPSL
jgi:WS/DGAT/MGAT family acyltransferase